MRKLLLVLMAIAIVGGCGKKKTSSLAGKPGKRPDLYIEISMLGHLDYFDDHKLGMRLVGEMLGVETDYRGPSTYNIDEMILSLELAIARKPGGLVVVGFEESLTPIVNKAVEAGIPVVTVDSDLPNSKRCSFVGTGNHRAGYTGGMKMAEILGGEGKVALMTKIGQPNLEERIRGYRDAIAKYPKMQIVQIVDTASDPIRAAQAAANLMQTYPDLAGIGCVEAAGGAGAATAVKEAGKVGKVKIVAMDRGTEVLQYIEEGVITASIAQQTALMPYYAVLILHTLNHADIPITTNNARAGVPGCPAIIDTGVIVVDKSNYRYFKRESRVAALPKRPAFFVTCLAEISGDRHPGPCPLTPGLGGRGSGVAGQAYVMLVAVSLAARAGFVSSW
ncbi:MAG: substrate-binding domain-containing protein [bacterium]|nr:substrate-binding domain-containing protein [bacterium]